MHRFAMLSSPHPPLGGDDNTIRNWELGIKGSVLHPKSSLCQREDLGGNVKMKNKDKK